MCEFNNYETNEVWKDIEGYEGYYQISNLGRVKSLARMVYDSSGNAIRFKPENIKKNKVSTDGYEIITLSVNNHNKTINIHILVANAFVEKPSSLEPLEVNHKDMNRRNNVSSNLEWVTHKDNVAYSRDKGKYKNKAGKQNPNYGNHSLHDYYKHNPQAKEKLARHGKDNGRCRSLSVFSNDEVLHFDYIRECAKWFQETYNIPYTIPTIHQQILRAATKETPYHDCIIKFD